MTISYSYMKEARDGTGLPIARSLASHLLEAIGTVDGPVGTGLEGDQRLFAAVAADGAEHLSLAAVTAATAASTTGAVSTVATTRLRGAPGRSALGAPARLVHQPVGRVEFLLARREGEGLTALPAVQGLVEVAHAD